MRKWFVRLSCGPDSECGEPQTISFSRKRKASECGFEMCNINEFGTTTGQSRASVRRHSFLESKRLGYYLKDGRLLSQNKVKRCCRGEELEKCSLGTDVGGIIDVLAVKACDREGRRRFVITKAKGANMVANAKQYAKMCV